MSGPIALEAPSMRGILLGGGPRFARDAVGPPLAFYLGWKTGGLVVGIAASTLVSVVAFRLERRAGRPAALARLTFGIVLVQAAVGLIAGSERVYLAQPVVVNAVLGLGFLGSVLVRRPLGAVFAGELYPFPDEVRATATFRRAFAVVTVVWGVYLCMRSGLRLWMLTSSSIEGFLLLNAATGTPCTLALLAWSIWFVRRAFQPELKAMTDAQRPV